MKAMNPNAVIELRDVAIFHFDDALREASFRGNGRTSDMVLSDVNLTVFPGELVYLIGRVGSGKSSLLKTLYAELSEIVAGKKTGRENDDERILFWHRGLSINDIALGRLYYKKAVANNIGTKLFYR